jgi:tRNA-modifying protein YgfZ
MHTADLSPGFDPLRLQGLARLDRWGVIRVQGEDAATFLHGQLTQDFALLGLDRARLAGYCSPKGRLLASFIGFKRTPDDILLLCERDLMPQTLKRLSMFVLRARARLSDASADFVLLGAVGSAVPAADLPAEDWAKAETPQGSWVRLPGAMGRPRALCCAPVSAAATVVTTLDPALWDWLEVRSGIAMVSAAVTDEFVPQMLNLESVGGVSFKKGCYPGQEVVARSQFRGVLKRRAFLVHAQVPLSAGQEVFHAADAQQPAGRVAAAAPHPEGGWDGIVSMQTAAADGAPLTLGAPDGPGLSLLPLPYELLQDI